jgi:uncharacterized membrane protein SpoIIM required for sporulation
MINNNLNWNDTVWFIFLLKGNVCNIINLKITISNYDMIFNLKLSYLIKIRNSKNLKLYIFKYNLQIVIN